MSSYYDNLNMDVKTLPERLREYYKPEDFVVIMNIDTKPLGYSIQRPENVRIHQPSPVTKELYYDKDPDQITLEPGDTRLCPAYEADWAIKQIIDVIVIGNRAQVALDGKTPTESAMDPSTQHKYIKKIFQGKRDFMSEYNQQLNKENDNRKQLEHDLEDNLPTGGSTYTPNLRGNNDSVNEPVKRGPGRPKAEVTPTS